MRGLILVLTLALLAVPLFGALAPAPAFAAATTTNTQSTVTMANNSVQTGDTITVTGRYFTPKYYAFISFQRPDGTTNSFNITTDGLGDFTFTLGFSAAHGIGTEYLRGYDYGTGRYTATVSITVTSTTPPQTTLQLTSDKNPVTPGHVATLTGTGFTPRSTVYFTYARPNGTTNAFYVSTDNIGRFDQQLGFLRSNGCGLERVQAYDFGTSRRSPVYTLTVTGC